MPGPSALPNASEAARWDAAANLSVSVCMAVHDGAAFVLPQIESILVQLRPGDELLVIDDYSRDASWHTLQTIKDHRVRLYRNEKNLGVLRAFERALELSRSEIVFLSDQDDVWLSGKVEKALNVFASKPEVTMVASDATLIDQDGRTFSESFFSTRGRFSRGFFHNFIKNKYLGCTLSFRRAMLCRFLPIPPDVPMHDIWFGLLNEIYGKTHFIDEPLVAYRRHARNVSPLTNAGLLQIVAWRYRLAKNICRRLAAEMFRSGRRK